ncbi:MAG: DNA repair protein RadA [Fervidobacterium sp.]
MAKSKTVYVCDKCGYESPKWFGKCPVCGEWNSAKEFALKESNEKTIRSNQAGMESPHPRFFDINSAVEISDEERIKSYIQSIDELLSGGIVKGQVILLGGEPGVGKSTIAMQICDSVARHSKKKVYYISGEESVSQVGLRAKRLGIKSKNLLISSETQIEDVLNTIDPDDAQLIVIDSIQTLSSADIDSPIGGVVQIKAVVEKVRIFSKKYGIPSILIAHVTKEGTIAGPKLVEHVVDTVIYFEGERTTDYRILRVQKNRYGPSGELSVFQMTNDGLKSLSEDNLLTYSQTPGNVFASVYEGSRPLNVQIQALVSRVKMAAGRRISHGIDVRKVIIISAVLSKHLNLPLDFHDIYINVSGGINITEPGCELAVAGAVLSSFLDAFIGNVFMVGEIGLDGSVRPAVNIGKRIENAKKLAVDKIVIPDVSLDLNNLKSSDLKVQKVKHVRQLFELILELKKGE